MNKKLSPSDYFQTYRPFSQNGVDWFVISNLTWDPEFISKHPDETSARDHARHLNALWRERFYGNHQASVFSLPQPPDNLDNVSLLRKLKNLLVGSLLFLRSRFQLR